MKILFVHNDYARPSGEEHAIDGIASMLAERGHEIVWYRRSSAEIAGSAAGQAKAFFTALHNPAAVKAVRELVKRERPDLAFVQNLYPLISPSVLPELKRLGVPIVMRCPNYRLFCPAGLLFSHGEICEKCLGRGRELWCLLRNCEESLPKSVGYALRGASARMRRAITKSVDHFVVLSEFQHRYFVRQGVAEKRIAIVPNTIPSDAGTSEAKPGRVIGFIGRIAAEKGFDDFVASARALPGLRFEAAGAVKAGYDVGTLPPNLTLRGFLSGDDLRDFVSNMKMLVTCSGWYEGFPNTITLAMAAGKPVVATNLGVTPEVVEEGVSGLLYAPGDVDALSAAIKRLAADERLCQQLGKAGREQALRFYTPQIVADTWGKVLQRCSE